MQCFQFLNRACRYTLITIAAGVGWLLLTCPAQAVTPSEADAAFDSLNEVYWDSKTNFFRKEEQGSKKADFWLSAQLWDTVMDQYERTGSDDVKRQIHELYDGFVKEYPDWTTKRYNDDIMWWTIACYPKTHRRSKSCCCLGIITVAGQLSHPSEAD